MMAKTSRLIETQVPVISAREDHEQSQPLNQRGWKTLAVTQLLKNENPKIQIDMNSLVNLIVMGD